MCTSTTRRFSRALHRQSADAGRLLWHHLRDRRMDGVAFARTHPIGPFVVDFLALDAATIVEIDAVRSAVALDAARARFLARRGFRVVRVWDHDVLVRTEQVLERIHDAVLAQRAAGAGHWRDAGLRLPAGITPASTAVRPHDDDTALASDPDAAHAPA